MSIETKVIMFAFNGNAAIFIAPFMASSKAQMKRKLCWCRCDVTRLYLFNTQTKVCNMNASKQVIFNIIMLSLSLNGKKLWVYSHLLAVVALLLLAFFFQRFAIFCIEVTTRTNVNLFYIATFHFILFFSPSSIHCFDAIVWNEVGLISVLFLYSFLSCHETIAKWREDTLHYYLDSVFTEKL